MAEDDLDCPTPATHNTSSAQDDEKYEFLAALVEEHGDLAAVEEIFNFDSARDFPSLLTTVPALSCGTIKKKTKHSPAAKALSDLSETHIATMLSQFKQLVTLGIAPEETAATLESQAARSLQIEREWQALIKAAEDLLKLTRELKELWLVGPLRGIGDGEDDGDMAENAKEVQELVDRITKKLDGIDVDTNNKSH